MKTKALYIIGLVGLVAITVAWKKPNTESPAGNNYIPIEKQNTVSQSSIPLAVSIPTNTRMRLYTDGDCEYDYGNCAPIDIVVTAFIQQQVLDIVESGVNTNIIAAFSNNYAALDEILFTTDLNKVIAGNLVATLEENTASGTQFLVLTAPNQSTPTRVYPFVQ